jgi:hypothetical protein
LTVCIGIACDLAGTDSGPNIVLISDRQICFGPTSTDTGMKTLTLCKDWRLMFAGNDIGMVRPVAYLAGSTLVEKGTTDLPDVIHAMVDAYQAIRRRSIEDTYLSSWGWKIEDFRNSGKALLPETHFQNLIYEIERFDLDCEFLVCGLPCTAASGNRAFYFPEIFYVNNPGIFSVVEDSLGYAAIGSGNTLAMAYLAQRRQMPMLTLEESVYNGIVAKHVAERSMGVGQETIVEIMYPGKQDRMLSNEKIETITEMWKQQEENSRPKNLREKMAEVLKP